MAVIENVPREDIPPTLDGVIMYYLIKFVSVTPADWVNMAASRPTFLGHSGRAITNPPPPGASEPAVELSVAPPATTPDEPAEAIREQGNPLY